MARMSLLEMVQNILSAMDSDEVNSVNDTVESQQVAEVIKETYYDLFANIDLPEHKGIIKLEGLGDLTRPNYLRIPTNVVSIDWVRYYDSDAAQYVDLEYWKPNDYLRLALLSDAGDPNNILVTDETGVSFYVGMNRAPSRYTIFNDNLLITDSYDAAFDSTLQASKTFAWGFVSQDWEMEDDFYPVIDPALFPLLLSESKSVCFVNIKQTANQKEEQRARRHRVHLQHRKWKDKANKYAEWEGTNYARNR